MLAHDLSLADVFNIRIASFPTFGTGAAAPTSYAIAPPEPDLFHAR